ncbi:MAG TPA: RNA polymerase sigma factor [Enhygromyxa sp.]|nr:RNA polymerase sigma factor [Enhygromyxa sp.]
MDTDLSPGPESLRQRFVRLYREHHAFVWRSAQSMGAGATGLDDAVQETFIIALRRLDDFDPTRSSEQTWLFAILRNVLRNQARAVRRRNQRHDAYAAIRELEDEGPDPRTEWAHGKLREFLLELEEPRRAVFVLTEIEGMTAPEIAEALGCNVNTVYSRLRTARHRFRQTFGAGLEVEVRRQATSQPDAEVRSRNWLTIASAGGLVGGEAVAPAALGAMSGWLGILGKGMLALSLAAAAVIVALVSRAEPPTGEREPVASSPAEAPVVERVERPADASAVELSDPPIEVATASSSTRRSPSKTASPTEAIALLERALALTEAGEHRAALDLLAGVRWPSDALAGRARTLEVELLCATGQRSLAERRAADWRFRHPDSLAAAQLEVACPARDLGR